MKINDVPSRPDGRYPAATAAAAAMNVATSHHYRVVRALGTVARILHIDAGVAAGAALALQLEPYFALSWATELAIARPSLAMASYRLLVIDPVPLGERGSIALLDEVREHHDAMPVLLYCGQLPGQDCRRRADGVLLKAHSPVALVLAMVRSLVAGQDTAIGADHFFP